MNKMNKINLHRPPAGMHPDKVAKFLETREVWLVAAKNHVSPVGKKWCLQNAASYLKMCLPYLTKEQVIELGLDVESRRAILNRINNIF